MGMTAIWALKDINFEVQRGESVAIIGRNGCGKSTLLEILTGTLTPTTGSVKVRGRVSAILELGSGFKPEFSGRDNVILNGLLLGLSKDDLLSRFGEIEAFAEIGAAIDRPVMTYSSGMLMRLAFAVQVLCNPDILIIDEALSVGDFFFRQKCFSHIRRLRERGATLLFVSHDMGAVRDLCSRAVYLRRGSLLADDTVNAGIQLYLNDDRSTKKENRKHTLQRCSSTATDLPEWNEGASWSAQIPGGKRSKILAVQVQNAIGQPTQRVSIGEIIRFVVWYQADEVEPVHVGIIIKNRYDQVVNYTSSYGLGIKMSPNSDGAATAFMVELQMNIEAGQYSVMANLSVISEKANQGVVLDETTWFGPLEIIWNYLSDVAPFLGMFGVPARIIPKL